MLIHNNSGTSASLTSLSSPPSVPVSGLSSPCCSSRDVLGPLPSVLDSVLEGDTPSATASSRDLLSLRWLVSVCSGHKYPVVSEGAKLDRGSGGSGSGSRGTSAAWTCKI
jgi:hypothetical protein